MPSEWLVWNSDRSSHRVPDGLLHLRDSVVLTDQGVVVVVQRVGASSTVQYVTDLRALSAEVAVIAALVGLEVVGLWSAVQVRLLTAFRVDDRVVTGAAVERLVSP